MADSRGGRAAILLGDDRAGDLGELRGMLAGLDVDLVDAPAPADILAALAAQPFAAVLLALGSPATGGLETLRRIRAQAPATPVLLLVDQQLDPATIEQGYALGAVDVVERPWIPLALQSKLRALTVLFAE